MKSLLAIFSFAVLFAACIRSADDLPATDLREKITDSNGNGKPEKIVKETYSDGKMIRSETITDTNEDGDPEVVAIKLYAVGKLVSVEIIDKRLRSHTRVHYLGKARFTESDLDLDGFFEWAVLSPESGQRVFLYRSRVDSQVNTRVVTEEEAKVIERSPAGQ